MPGEAGEVVWNSPSANLPRTVRLILEMQATLLQEVRKQGSGLTYRGVCQKLEERSIFCGRNPTVSPSFEHKYADIPYYYITHNNIINLIWQPCVKIRHYWIRITIRPRLELESKIIIAMAINIITWSCVQMKSPMLVIALDQQVFMECRTLVSISSCTRQG